MCTDNVATLRKIMLFVTLGVLLVMKRVEDEWYVAIKAYKFAVFEILRDFFVLAWIACTSYPYI